jgi:hypothetical protein
MVCGSVDESHLAPLRHHEKIRVVGMSAEHHTVISDWSVQRKIAFNFVRALTLLPFGEDVLVAEDDIVLCDGWLASAAAMFAAAREKHGKFLLLLFSPDTTRDDGDGFGSYDGRMFGGQLVLVPAELRASLASFVTRECVVGDASAHDACLRAYCVARRTVLLAASRSLAQHVGSVSTHGNLRHIAPRSSTFGHLASEDADF